MDWIKIKTISQRHQSWDRYYDNDTQKECCILNIDTWQRYIGGYIS